MFPPFHQHPLLLPNSHSTCLPASRLEKPLLQLQENGLGIVEVSDPLALGDSVIVSMGYSYPNQIEFYTPEIIFDCHPC